MVRWQRPNSAPDARQGAQLLELLANFIVVLLQQQYEEGIARVEGKQAETSVRTRSSGAAAFAFTRGNVSHTLVVEGEAVAAAAMATLRVARRAIGTARAISDRETVVVGSPTREAMRTEAPQNTKK